MKVPLSWISRGAAFGGACMALWLFLLWRPARQVELHTANLLARASARDWPAVADMMAADFRDPSGAGRDEATGRAREVFSHFFVLHIAPLEPWRVEAGTKEGAAVARVGVFGSGTAVAGAVMDEVRGLGAPFVFRWKKSGPWPWQWELSGAEQDELRARVQQGL